MDTAPCLLNTEVMVAKALSRMDICSGRKSRVPLGILGLRRAWRSEQGEERRGVAGGWQVSGAKQPANQTRYHTAPSRLAWLP